MDKLVNQASALPTRKVTSAFSSGAVVTALVWALNTYAGVNVPPEVATAVATIVSFAVAYFTRERAQ